MTIGEYFMHKWRHVLYVMTSSIIPPLSILTTWIRGGLTALRLERSELNLIPIVCFRAARRINHQIFIKARLGAQLSKRTWVLLICVQNETFFHAFFFHMKERVPGVALIRSLKANGNRKRTIVEHGQLPDWEAYCTGSESNSNSDVRALVTWLLDVRD